MRKIAVHTAARKIAIELVDENAVSVDLLHDHVSTMKQSVCYQSPPYKGGKKYLSMIETMDKDGSPFYHVQRMGKDSVAFLCFSRERIGELLCLTQWSSPYRKMVTGCYTGSLDKPEKSMVEIVVEEVYEEAGIVVTEDHVHALSAEMVGGSSDETVHLFLVDVTGHRIDPKNPENTYEALAQRLWLTIDEIHGRCEWKARLVADCYQKNLMNEPASLVLKVAAMDYHKMIAWKTLQNRRSIMSMLQKNGIEFQLDYSMFTGDDEQGYRFGLTFKNRDIYEKAKKLVFDPMNKPGKLQNKIIVVGV